MMDGIGWGIRSAAVALIVVALVVAALVSTYSDDCGCS
jgi:hypothetical protein